MNNLLTEKYSDGIRNTVRYPLYKIELLRKDETPYSEFEGQVVDNSGSLNITDNDGVRRTCNFTLANYNKELTPYVESLTIGDKFRLYLGESIDDEKIFFDQGVFIFNNPVCRADNGDNSIQISGTDKWSCLNGSHGGVLEGTYIVKSGSTFGDMVRRTLALDIVNDPITPNIHPNLEDVEITYDITKTHGDTIADIFLDVSLNINARIYYDKSGRLTAMPIEEYRYKATSFIFENDDIALLSSEKTIGLENVYNSVLVVSENTTESGEEIITELKNEDLSDPNSIPNCGIKKVYIVNDYLAGITTQELCDIRAKYELRKIKEILSSFSVQTTAILYLDEGDVVLIDNSDINKVPERYAIKNISRTIGTDIQMSMDICTIEYI